MIFVTVGTQLPFDRLVEGVDHWAESHGRSDVFAQVGVGSKYNPVACGHAAVLGQSEFQERFKKASVIVSHAGIGTILSALELGKPIVVLARRAQLGEHRNDHQLATAEKFTAMNLVKVARDMDELARALDEAEKYRSDKTISSQASPELVGYLRGFINS